jgi:hypothetical protein
VYGQSVTFTATVSVLAPGIGTPSGTVAFYDGGALLGTGSVAGGTATLTTSALVTGTHSITATYTGDSNLNSSTSSVLLYTVGAPYFTSVPTTTAYQGVLYTYNITTSSPNTSAVLTITATVKPAWLTLTPTGNGTASLSGTPSYSDIGQYTVVLQVIDNGGLTATQSFTISVKTRVFLPVVIK